MLYILYALFFISCIVLIGAVLLQPGKTDAGALFTSNVSSAAFGPRGTATALSKATTWSAVIFMVTSITLSVLAQRRTGPGSVLEGVKSAPTQTKPATPPPAAPAQPK